jgi:hypothetical protein
VVLDLCHASGGREDAKEMRRIVREVRRLGARDYVRLGQRMNEILHLIKSIVT